MILTKWVYWGIFLFLSQAVGNVWVIDDGEKIKRDSTSLRFEQGIDNPIWAPGEPVRLFALKNETIALQVVIEAEGEDLTSVTVDLDGLQGPDGATIENTSTDPSQFVGRFIERFVEHYVYVDRKSGGPWAETLWWGTGAEPPDSAWTGWMPDALIPVEAAPNWSPYPLQITAGTNGVVWIDITIPKDQRPGLYTGKIVVKNNGTLLKELDMELTIHDIVLPEWPLKTMFFYEYEELARRIGGQPGANVDDAEKYLWQLFHRHRITPFYTALTVADVEHILGKLNGSVYTQDSGYQGPAEGRGDDLLSLGTYGGYGEPDNSDLLKVEDIADKLAEENLFSATDVFVYATDEDCGSSWGQEWKDLLKSSANPNVDSVLVGWTCSDDPVSQPVDLIMMGSAEYNTHKVETARDSGKIVWIYNGFLPKSGAYITDLDAVSPRANGLIQAYYGIERWFYWETTFWYDWNPGGWGAYDPFVESESFHNNWNEYGNGDGMLVYPGKQVDQFTEHSIGLDGVIASIRLKNIRRGIQDAGYYQLAAQLNEEKANNMVAALIHPALSYVSKYSAPSWGTTGQEFFNLRDSLLQIIINPSGFGEETNQGINRPENFRINNIYPNPFNPQTNISFHIPKRSRVILEIYNLLGEKLITLMDRTLPKGSYNTIWHASGYSSGIYIVKLQAEAYSYARKITLIR